MVAGSEGRNNAEGRRFLSVGTFTDRESPVNHFCFYKLIVFNLEK